MRRWSAVLVVLVAMTTLAGCGGSKDGGGSGSLSFKAVRATTPSKDPVDACPYTRWDPNPTGVDEKYRAGVKFFRQYDCYKKPYKDVGGIADLGSVNVVSYIEFDTSAQAKAFVKDYLELATYAHLVDGAKVVSLGMGLGKNMTASAAKSYLRKLQKACDCGKVQLGKSS